MITFEEAYNIVLSHLGDFGTEQIPLQRSMGRILKENWYADRDFPPFDRVMMDGIAIKYKKPSLNNTSFAIEEIAAAGEPQKTLNDPVKCIEVMTGAPLPLHTDTVIRYEDVELNETLATVTTSIKKGQNIHTQGKDKKQGDLLISKNKIITVADVGVGASIGKAKVLVNKLPSTLIVSTGDELVPITKKPLPHQIRKSNVHQIAATLNAKAKIEADLLHLADDKDEIERKLSIEIGKRDLIILSGGVSKGKFDFIPDALEKLGVKKLFHRVRQRPGKPFWFGVHPSGCTVFALPGNPISSFMCVQVYLSDWLDQSLGLEVNQPRYAMLTNDVTFHPDLTYFMEVKIESDHNGQLWAHPKKGNGSGDLANLSKANAFIRLPSGRNQFQKGECFLYHQYTLL